MCKECKYVRVFSFLKIEYCMLECCGLSDNRCSKMLPSIRPRAPQHTPAYMEASRSVNPSNEKHFGPDFEISHQDELMLQKKKLDLLETSMMMKFNDLEQLIQGIKGNYDSWRRKYPEEVMSLRETLVDHIRSSKAVEDKLFESQKKNWEMSISLETLIKELGLKVVLLEEKSSNEIGLGQNQIIALVKEAIQRYDTSSISKLKAAISSNLQHIEALSDDLKSLGIHTNSTRHSDLHNIKLAIDELRVVSSAEIDSRRKDIKRLKHTLQELGRVQELDHSLLLDTLSSLSNSSVKEIGTLICRLNDLENHFNAMSSSCAESIGSFVCFVVASH